jgi:hypothetical protein
MKFKENLAYESEIECVYKTITHPAGYDVDCAGILCVRQYEYPV